MILPQKTLKHRKTQKQAAVWPLLMILTDTLPVIDMAKDKAYRF
jgi:hypothetical protein